MKATYQKPTTDVVLVMSQTILAGSANLGNGVTPSSIDLSQADNTDNIQGTWTPGSRRGSLWDDEEE